MIARDHNSLGEATIVMMEALFSDIMDQSGIDLSRDLDRLRSIGRESGFVGMQSFLDKHRKVYLEWLQTEALTPTDVAHHPDGTPIFLSQLWHALTGNYVWRTGCDRVFFVSALEQVFALSRKLRSRVAMDGGRESFIHRMRLNAATCALHTMAERTSRMVRMLIGDDLDYKVVIVPPVSTGARLDHTDILVRMDEVGASTWAKFTSSSETLVSGPHVNRLVEVPKDWSKNRLVFAESNAAMQSQQKIRCFIETRCQQSREGRTRIDFVDQESQRRSLRRQGVASIDLSDASDRLSTYVVWRLWRKLPILRAEMFACRSHRTQCGIPLTCYGTMGNATTFPVMTVTLCAIAMAVEEYMAEITGTRYKRTTVFGDDIVCDDRIAEEILYHLEAFGLVPNRTKTFVGSRYKESCGINLYDSYDVTPVHVKEVHGRAHADRYRNVQTSNAFYERGWWHTARLFFEESAIAHVNVDETSHRSFTTNVVTTGCRWSRRYQKYVPKGPHHRKTVVLERDSHLDLQYALYHGTRVRTQKTQNS